MLYGLRFYLKKKYMAMLFRMQIYDDFRILHRIKEKKNLNKEKKRRFLRFFQRKYLNLPTENDAISIFNQ